MAENLKQSFIDSVLVNHTCLKGGRVPHTENFDNQESRRRHLWSFCRGNFTFSTAPILNIRFRQIMHMYVLVLGVDITVQI